MYRKTCSELDGKEQSAAFALCHFDVTWPGDDFSINLANQRHNLSLANGANKSVVGTLLPGVLTVFVIYVGRFGI